MRVVEKPILTQLALELWLSQSGRGVSINRMPGIEADMLRAWVACFQDAALTISKFPRQLHLLKQNTGFYSLPGNEVDELQTWCTLYLNALQSSTMLYRLETDYAAQNDYLVDGFQEEIHVWSANSLHAWLPLLEGKKVLICSPFTKTIEGQLGKRNALFKGGHIPFEYPTFEPVLVQAHNTILGNEPHPCQGWTASLDMMFEEIVKHEFDIAILGCGGYGVPLCDKLRDAGKKAFYVGSYCQIMFGIKGKRWENEGNPIGSYFNSNWVNPSQDERPPSYVEVEGGCYW
tara:strand:+ start:7213 stop:8079 length:867 start_codon:yes stop_codon:yes gene_type:complete